MIGLGKPSHMKSVQVSTSLSHVNHSRELYVYDSSLARHMRPEEGSSAMVPLAPRSCTTRGRGRRRSTHWSNPKQVKAQKRRRENDTASNIVEVDCNSDETEFLNSKALGAIREVCLTIHVYN